MSLYIGIKRRGGTAAAWTAANPILLERQWGFETDSFTLSGGIRYYKFKIGDGTTAWNSLPYAHLAPSSAAAAAAWGTITGTLSAQTDLQTALDAKEATANKATSFTTVNDTLFPTVEAVTEYVATAISGLYDDRGNFDASVNTFPASGGSGTAGAVLKGDIWTVSVAGTLGGNAVQIGDLVRALQDTPGQTSSNWAVTQNNITYVPENQANKEDTTLDTSTTKYPTNRLVKEQVDTKVTIGDALPISGGSLTGAVNESTGPSVASGGTVDLTPTNAGNYYTITGSTGPITSFGTIQAGTRRILTFTGTPTITHNATSMILPTGANIIVAAGDSATFVSLGSGNWKCTQYQRADGTALVGAAGGLEIGVTTIASGTVGRIPFHGASDLLQESANFSIDESGTDKILKVGGTAQGRIELRVGGNLKAYATSEHEGRFVAGGDDVANTAYGYTGGQGGMGFPSNLKIVFGMGGATMLYMQVSSIFQNGLAGITAPTAKLHIPAQAAGAGTAPIKLDQSATLMTTPEAGAIESDSTKLYWTNGAGTRKEIQFV